VSQGLYLNLRSTDRSFKTESWWSSCAIRIPLGPFTIASHSGSWALISRVLYAFTSLILKLINKLSVVNAYNSL